MVCASFPFFTQAQQDTSGAGASDKIDIKGLEQKYWSAKDDDFTVVQNRMYSKAKRYYTSLVGGVPVNDPYSTGTIYGLHAGYFFNERWGLDLEYTKGAFKNNDATDQFIANYNTWPNNNKFDSSLGLSISFFPLYAKMSFLDKSIIYFDMGVSAGIGTLDYRITKIEGDEKNSAFSYNLAITQQIFFSPHLALRADYMNRWTVEKRSRYNPHP